MLGHAEVAGWSGVVPPLFAVLNIGFLRLECRATLSLELGLLDLLNFDEFARRTHESCGNTNARLADIFFLTSSLLTLLSQICIFGQQLLLLFILQISFPITVSLAHFWGALTFGAISTLRGVWLLTNCGRGNRFCDALPLWCTCAHLGVHSDRFALDFYRRNSWSSLDRGHSLIGPIAELLFLICLRFLLYFRLLGCCFAVAKQ